MFKQTRAYDPMMNQITYARACKVSRDYVLVRVHCSGDPEQGLTLLTGELTEDQRRFALEDITPNEYLVSIGKLTPVDIDRSR